MATESERENIIRKGSAASHLLSDEIVQQAFEAITADCFTAWCATNPADTTAREDAYRLHRCVSLLKQKLEKYRDDGIVERDNAAHRLRIARENDSNLMDIAKRSNG